MSISLQRDCQCQWNMVSDIPIVVSIHIGLFSGMSHQIGNSMKSHELFNIILYPELCSRSENSWRADLGEDFLLPLGYTLVYHVSAKKGWPGFDSEAE